MTRAAARATGADLPRTLIPLAIGLAPLLLVILTWVPEDMVRTPLTLWMKRLAMPALGAELLTILFALLYAPKAPLDPMVRKLRIPLLSLLLVMFATAFFVAPNPLYAAMRSLIWVVHLLFAAALARLCSAGLVRGRDIVTWLIIGLCGVAAATALFALQLERPGQFNWVNGLPGFDHLRRIGYYAAPVAALCIGSMAIAGSRSRWLIALAGMTLAVALIFWSGSRGGIAAVAAAAVAGLLLFPQARTWQAVAGAASASTGGFFLAQIVPSASVFMGAGRMVAKGVGSDSRLMLWKETLDAISARPLFGYGEAQIMHVTALGDKHNFLHPHNFPLQLLLAWGVVGLILVLVIALPLGWRILSETRRRGGKLLPPALAMIAILAFSSVDGTLFHVQSTAIFFTCLGISLGHRKSGET